MSRGFRHRGSTDGHPEVAAAEHLAQQFRELFRDRNADGLDGWLKTSQASGISTTYPVPITVTRIGLESPGEIDPIRNRASRHCTAFRRTNASGMEFMICGFYGNDFGVGVATHDSPAHHKLQIADPLQ